MPYELFIGLALVVVVVSVMLLLCLQNIPRLPKRVVSEIARFTCPLGLLALAFWIFLNADVTDDGAHVAAGVLGLVVVPIAWVVSDWSVGLVELWQTRNK